MDEPLISVITPSYQSGAFIEETIQSVLKQDYTNLEYLVMDGGSIDGTIEILRKYPQIEWISEPDHGQSHAINKGFQQAKGEIIGWINADDTYEPGVISKIVEHFLMHPEIDVVYGKCKQIDENGKFLSFYPTEPFNLRKLLFTDFIAQPALFFRKEIFQSTGYLNEKLHYVLDWEYWLRIAQRHRFEYLPKYVIANLRICPGTKSWDHAPEFQREFLGVLDQIYLQKPYAQVSKWLFWRAKRCTRSRYYMCLVYQAKRTERYDLIRKNLPLALLYDPRWFRNIGTISMIIDSILGPNAAARLGNIVHRITVA